MGIISDGIKNVRVFMLSAGVGADGSGIEESLFVLVQWHSEYEDRLYEVYADGKLAGTTHGPDERQIVVPVCLSECEPVRIEIYAVYAGETQTDYSGQLGELPKNNRAEMNLAREISLPYEGIAEVYSNNGNGQIDYGEPVTKEKILLWPGWQDKTGFGLGSFSIGDFGFDGSGVAGFRKGEFGEGQFGFGAETIAWLSGELATGIYRFGVKVTDQFGNSGEPIESEEKIVIQQAIPAENVGVVSYDKASNELVLEVS